VHFSPAKDAATSSVLAVPTSLNLSHVHASRGKNKSALRRGIVVGVVSVIRVARVFVRVVRVVRVIRVVRAHFVFFGARRGARVRVGATADQTPCDCAAAKRHPGGFARAHFVFFDARRGARVRVRATTADQTPHNCAAAKRNSGSFAGATLAHGPCECAVFFPVAQLRVRVVSKKDAGPCVFAVLFPDLFGDREVDREVVTTAAVDDAAMGQGSKGIAHAATAAAAAVDVQVHTATLDTCNSNGWRACRCRRGPQLAAVAVRVSRAAARGTDGKH
jgi:hypothetical protein